MLCSCFSSGSLHVLDVSAQAKNFPVITNTSKSEVFVKEEPESVVNNASELTAGQSGVVHSSEVSTYPDSDSMAVETSDGATGSVEVPNGHSMDVTPEEAVDVQVKVEASESDTHDQAAVSKPSDADDSQSGPTEPANGQDHNDDQMDIVTEENNI